MAGKVRKTSVFALALLMAVLCRVPALAAQEPRFWLDMDSLNLQKGVSSHIVVSLVNAQGAQLLGIEGLENFDVLSQSQSTSTSFIQGETTYQTDLYFTVIPKTTGQFSLKAVIQYNGQTYETTALVVMIGEENAKGRESAPDLFVETSLSHDTAFLGEKVLVTYALYTRHNIENYGFTNYVAIDGMMVKDMPEDQLRAEYVYVNGVRYAKYEVKQLIVDPIKSGVYTIPSFHLQVNVITTDSMGGFGSGPFGGLGGFFSFSEPVYLQTEAKELTVKPLPSEGKPADFSGIVGELRLDGVYSRDVMNYGDSFVLQVTAYGRCNLDGLKNVLPNGMPGFTAYETQKNTVESVANNQYKAEKTFDVILVPEKTGALDVAPVSIPYFNPVTETYEKAEIPGTTVEVLGEMPPLPGVYGQGAAVETVRIQQVHYADAGDDYFSIKIKKTVFFEVLIGLGVLAVLAAGCLWLISRRKKRDLTLKSLYKRLMATQDVHEIVDLFSAMMKHRYHLSIKASAQNMIRDSLPDPALAAEVAEIMAYMESEKAHEEKGYLYLKDKIKGVYLKHIRA